MRQSYRYFLLKEQCSNFLYNEVCTVQTVNVVHKDDFDTMGNGE